MSKITIIGAGRVGESTAQFIAQANLVEELVLIDIRQGAAEGAALDVQETAPLFGFDTRIRGGTDYELARDSEIVVVTAGIPRKPGMSRSDVLDTNVKILDSIVDAIDAVAANALLLIVSNPVDVLTYRAWQRSGWPRQRVFGQAGVLDSARMATFIALETGLSVQGINAMVLGGHGDSMVPMIRYSSINGIPIKHFLDAAAIDRIVERTRKGGAEILALRQNSSAFDAPAAAVYKMVNAIIHNRKQLLPSVAILENEYGEDNVAMGVPCILGSGGMEKIIQLNLNDEEQAMFSSSLNGVKADIQRLKN